MYLGGDGVGAVAVALLYGDANPCGKLAESFPIKLSDNPSYLNFPDENGVVEYREGIYVGYRYYDKKRWRFSSHLAMGFLIQALNIVI
ncbi:MAG: glycoside hydrolase family 3 C-terminal domain-containing protein [Lachnotalea sp.]